MVLVNGRRFIEQRRGRRFVALVAFLLLAAQVGFSLHAAGHSTIEASATCAVCLTADQPIGSAPALIPVGSAVVCDEERPQQEVVTSPRRMAFLLPPTRGPPTRS